MGLDMYLYDMKKIDNPKTMYTHELLSCDNINYIPLEDFEQCAHLYEDIAFLFTLATLVVEEDMYDKYSEYKVDDKFYIPIYIWKQKEVMYWRKEYEIQELIYECLGDIVENCGYYIVNDFYDDIETMMKNSDMYLNSKANIHKRCNEHKCSEVFSIEEYEGMVFLDFDKFKVFYEECLPDIKDYLRVKNEMIIYHGDTCAVCGNTITTENMVIRRLNNRKPRSIENAKLLCENFNCQHKFTRDRKKYN